MIVYWEECVCVHNFYDKCVNTGTLNNHFTCILCELVIMCIFFCWLMDVIKGIAMLCITKSHIHIGITAQLNVFNYYKYLNFIDVRNIQIYGCTHFPGLQITIIIILCAFKTAEVRIKLQWLLIIIGFSTIRSLWCNFVKQYHYSDVLMSTMPSQITGVSISCSTIFLRCSSKNTSKLRITGLCEGNPRVTGGLPSQRASNMENIFIWWHHHDNKT